MTRQHTHAHDRGDLDLVGGRVPTHQRGNVISQEILFEDAFAPVMGPAIHPPGRNLTASLGLRTTGGSCRRSEGRPPSRSDGTAAPVQGTVVIDVARTASEGGQVRSIAPLLDDTVSTNSSAGKGDPEVAALRGRPRCRLVVEPGRQRLRSLRKALRCCRRAGWLAERSSSTPPPLAPRASRALRHGRRRHGSHLLRRRDRTAPQHPWPWARTPTCWPDAHRPTGAPAW